MPDKFDPYREALVMEQATVWPEQYDAWEAIDKRHIEKLLHEAPEEAAILDYIRQHSGFCRQITVTQQDVERLSAAP